MKTMQPVQSLEDTQTQQPTSSPDQRPAPPWRPWGFLIWLGVALVTHALFCFAIASFEDFLQQHIGSDLPGFVDKYFYVTRTIYFRYVPTGFILLAVLIGNLLGVHFLLRRHRTFQRVYAVTAIISLFAILLIVFITLASYVDL